MDFFFDNLKKILTLTFAVMFAVVVLYTPQYYGKVATVPAVEAAIPVIDIESLTKENFLDRIAWVLSKSIVSSMVASTIDWINSGFEGSPAFVQDLDRYLLNVLDEVAGAYLEELGGPLSKLCSPFRLDIQVALALEYQEAREPLPYQGCRLSEAFDNFEAFIEGDFLQGGWDDFIQITTQPERYTPLGAKYAAQRGLERALAEAEKNERDTLAYGDGFLSFKVCSDVTGPEGKIYQDCKIHTPGKTIATRLSDSLGLGEQTLITADEFNEIISALISQLAVKALTGTAGLLGLSTNSTYSDIGYSGSYTDGVRQGSTDAERSTLVDAVDNINATLSTQRAYLTVATNYKRQAETVLNNTGANSQLRQAALTVRSETDEVIKRSSSNIVEIEQALATYNALEDEYNNPETTAARKETILDEQRTLVIRTLQGSFYKESDIDVAEERWDGLLNPDDE